MGKPRCSLKTCKKKLGMMEFTCGCGGKFCTEHRLPEEHQCIFNHKSKDKEILEDKLLKEKLENTKVINKL